MKSLSNFSPLRWNILKGYSLIDTRHFQIEIFSLNRKNRSGSAVFFNDTQDDKFK